MKKFLSIAIILVISAAFLFAGGASDQSYPNRNISVIVQFSAGGPTDLSVRGLLDSSKGATFAVENVTGGAGLIGLTRVATSPTDGYTLGCINVDLAINYAMGRTDLSPTDFVPLACSIFDPYTLVVRADAPYDNIQEFVEYCKAHPGEVSFGNSGIGGIWHFVAAAFAQAAGIEVTHVPFEGGGTAVVALAGGHVDAVPVTPQEVEVQVKAGTAKILAVLAPERLSYLPDVPTAAEYGYDNLVFTIWRGFGVPLNTPQEVVDRLAEAFQAALDDEAVTQFMNERGYSKAYMSGPELYDLMAREEAIYAEQAVALGLKQN